ncbi:uncharacterized protein LOC131234777 [Magnolia sinica]|uniref:uncharacterized protein LOC131234777 n=1 Tax=Magnolia sinica TaxID=86752 RepID=UPI002657ED76|nr:uncharacterized protein LOC131234777 [Magnolia sinica]
MGNCLVPQEKVIKVMKMDGQILEYKPPMQVHQVLSDHVGHAITDTLPVSQHLPPQANMRSGHLYFLLPPPLPLPSHYVDCKVSDMPDSPIVEMGRCHETPVVRIKVLITKQELKEILTKGGLSVDEMISSLKNKPTVDVVSDDGSDHGCRGWRPILESIPEGNDLN